MRIRFSSPPYTRQVLFGIAYLSVIILPNLLQHLPRVVTGGLELFHACKRFFLRGQDSTRFSEPFNKGWAIESQQSNQRPSCYAANKQGEENDAQRQRDDEISVRKFGWQAQGECQGYSTLQPSPEKHGLVPQSYWFRAAL